MTSRTGDSIDWTERIVSVTTEDGLTHAGLHIQPAPGVRQQVAIVWMHGLTGTFYSRTAVAIGRWLAGNGYHFVSGNNRGHDFGYVLGRPPGGQVRLGGGGWELFSESPRDVAAWVEVAANLEGVRGVLLCGHSLGALKVGYYQAQRADQRVLGIVAASPPRGASRLKPEVLARARQLADEGRAQDLLPWGSHEAGAGTQSAQTYLDREQSNLDVYGQNGNSPHVGRIRCPLFVCFGTEEAWVGDATDLERIRRNAVNAPRVETALFQGADHSYAGHEDEVAATVARWAASLA